MSTPATAGFSVFIELSVVHVVLHIIAHRLIATEPELQDTNDGLPTEPRLEDFPDQDSFLKARDSPAAANERPHEDYVSRQQLVVHIPHSSLTVPAEARSTIVLSDEALDDEIVRMTDWFTDELFISREPCCTAVVAHTSRLVVDVERFPEECDELMADRGMGAIYLKTSGGARLRGALTAAERQAWMNRWYYPHHETLTRYVDESLAIDGSCLVIDGHSFPSQPLPYELDQGSDRPDICLGTDAFHTPPKLLKVATDYFCGHGLGVKVNRPFAGCIVPAKHYRQTRAVAAIMVEVNRGCYLDEPTAKRTERFGEIQDITQGFIRLLASWGGLPKHFD